MALFMQRFHALRNFAAPSFQVAQPVLHKCLHVAHFYRSHSCHPSLVSRQPTVFRQFSNGIGELDTAPGARLGSSCAACRLRAHNAYRHQTGIHAAADPVFDKLHNPVDFTFIIQSVLFVRDNGIPDKSPFMRFASTGWVTLVS